MLIVMLCLDPHYLYAVILIINICFNHKTKQLVKTIHFVPDEDSNQPKS